MRKSEVAGLSGYYVPDSLGFDFALQPSETTMKLYRFVGLALQRNSSAPHN